METASSKSLPKASGAVNLVCAWSSRIPRHQLDLPGTCRGGRPAASPGVIRKGELMKRTILAVGVLCAAVVAGAAGAGVFPPPASLSVASGPSPFAPGCDGGAHGLVAATSFNGGASWTRSFAHFSICAGGTVANGGDFQRASDPWVTFS